MNKFGKELKEYLDFYNISTQDFSKRCGINLNLLQSIIEGKEKLNNDTIDMISESSGIPSSYIRNVEKNYELDKRIKKYLEENTTTAKKFLNSIDYKNLIRKYNIVVQDAKDDINIIRNIHSYFKISNPEELKKYKQNNHNQNY